MKIAKWSVIAVCCWGLIGQVMAQEESVQFDPLLYLEASVLTSPPTKLANLLDKSTRKIVQRWKEPAPPVSKMINEDVESVERWKAAQQQAKNTKAFAWLPVEQQVLTDHLKDTYRVDRRLATDIVTTAFQAGQKYDLDPLLILAIIKVESTFNPKAVSVADAKGLMQVLPRAHPQKIEAAGGEEKLFLPHINIKMGAKILREYLELASGSLTSALLRYNGSSKDPTQKYAKRVMEEREKLEIVQVKATLADTTAIR